MKSKEITPKSISTVEAGHVRISAQPESRQESQDRDLVFFSGSGHSFGWVSQISYSVRMFQTSFLVREDNGCLPFLQKYPVQGILLNGLLYQPLKSELLILEIDSGWSAKKEKKQIWPTPTRSMFEMKDLDAYLERRKSCKESAKNGNGFGLTLAMAVRIEDRKTWPTICASQYRGSGPLGSKSHQHRLDRGYLDATVIQAEQTSGCLNPDWVEVLMGYKKGYSLIDAEEENGWDGGIPRLEDGGWTVRSIEDEPKLIDPVSWADGTWEEGISRLITGKDKSRAKRIRALGNSVVPQCVSVLAEKIGIWWKDNQN